jgi:hypothetical protein
MKQDYNRRGFIRTATIAGVGLGFAESIFPFNSFGMGPKAAGKRVGIIGLDTSHSVAFTKSLNTPGAGSQYKGYTVVAAYPYGSNDIQSSAERIPGYIEDVKKLGVEISGSIKQMLSKVDVVLLETNDGRLHLEQAIEVFKAGKPVFIDKPIAATLADAIAIFKAAEKYKVPVFSSSSLRFSTGAQEIANGKVGTVLGADTYSPSKYEKTHTELFWYGIHGVETLYTVMGIGCKSVVQVDSRNTDLVVGTWNDGRVGTFRGIHEGRQVYGGTVFGDKGVEQIGNFGGYDPLLIEVIKFFETGIPPVSAQETLEICAFMEAAYESKQNNGASVTIESMFKKAMAAR